MKTPMIK